MYAYPQFLQWSCKWEWFLVEFCNSSEDFQRYLEGEVVQFYRENESWTVRYEVNRILQNLNKSTWRSMELLKED